MAVEKPRSVKDYRRWLDENHGVSIDQTDQTYYESVVRKLRSDFASSEFWGSLSESLRRWDAEFRIRTGYKLVPDRDAVPELLEKPWESFLEKTFRKNIVHNEFWPDPPDGGWLLPPEWVTRVSDCVRTSFVAQYLDGAKELSDRLIQLSESFDLSQKVDYEARSEGYYAIHVNIVSDYALPKTNWDTQTREAAVELQVTTQLQNVIRRLTHQYYDNRRAEVEHHRSAEPWQWQYESDEFIANYLGHILHYVEGMIMEVRQRQREESTL